ncbi:hypothetical protein D7Z54_14315 [Salibacterium salarium]|uniref:Uncharacterized protein n=1 Tax=Salibacterium salarium TaxID=284579 RepID=A0A3R9RD03_9BACI|nr:hypothetical protein [Salibacterium salarium]RSL32622.1 hypothetical protein D7Z54_14315 [Salibacterium salarium]
MVYAMMGAGAVLGYFLLQKSPISIHKKLLIQLVLAALMIVLLIYFIQMIYSLIVGAIVLTGLLLLFSVLFGKQMEYSNRATEVEFGTVTVDETEEVEQGMVQDRETPVSPVYHVSPDNRYFMADDKSDAVDRESVHSSVQDDSFSANISNQEVEKEFFQRRSFMIEEDEEEEEKDIEDEVSPLPELKSETNETDTQESEDVHIAGISDKRMRLLEELDEGDEKGEKNG